MRANALLGFLLILSLAFSGCSVIMALKQPEKKNLEVLRAGVSRENVVTYLGAPISSEIKEGEKIDIYQFKQGYSGGSKATRALVHATADVFTFFIWEAVGIPTEAVLHGTKMTVRVTYDKEDKVKDFVFLQGK